MSIICPTCRRHNPAQAKFCACCGRVLLRASCRSGTSGSVVFVIIVVGFVLWSTGWRGFPVAWVARAREVLSFSNAPKLISHHFKLGSAKADAMFDLLAPSDIKVRVGRTDHGVSIKGTPGEAEALESFIQLLVRHEADGQGGPHRSMEQLSATWTKRETYKLPSKKARCLRHILAFDDVPVYVQGHSKSVVVDATAADQQTLAGVVDILRGQR